MFLDIQLHYITKHLNLKIQQPMLHLETHAKMTDYSKLQRCETEKIFNEQTSKHNMSSLEILVTEDDPLNVHFHK